MCNHQLRLIQHMTHISKSPSIKLCSTADRIVKPVKTALHQHDWQWESLHRAFCSPHLGPSKATPGVQHSVYLSIHTHKAQEVGNLSLHGAAGVVQLPT